MFHRFLVGNYKIDKLPDELIGKGTFGDVWSLQGCHQVFKVYRASRLYRTLEAGEGAFIDYQKAIKTLKPIHHKNILKVFGASVIEESDEDFRFCLVLERCECNLVEYLKRKSCAMRLDKLRDFAIHISCGLSLLRDKYLQHIDLKPENILYGSDKNFKVAEVDTIKMHPHMFSKFKHDALNAPHPYMAPELKRALKSISASKPQKLHGKINAEKVNVFSFGLIMYTCLHPTRTVDMEEVSRFLETNNPAMSELIDLLKQMLQETSCQRASLDHVCFSQFFLRKALPASVKIIGTIEHCRQHEGAITPGLMRMPSSTAKSTHTAMSSASFLAAMNKTSKRPSSPYVLTFKENVVRMRSVDVVNGWEAVGGLKDFLSDNPRFNTEITKVFLFTGTNAAFTEEVLGYNKTALTDTSFTEEQYTKKDADFVRSSLKDTGITEDRIKVISLGDYTNDFFGFCKNLEGYNNHSDILIPAFCYAPNSDVSKIIQAYKNQRDLYQYLSGLNRSMTRQNIINLSGSIVRKYQKTQRYLWDNQVLAKTDFPAEQLSSAETIHVDMNNFKGVLTKAKKFMPNVILLSFSVSGNVSLTSYLHSLKSARPSDRCVIQ